MAEKILNTRIITKHAELATWESSTLQLKEGEIVLAKINVPQFDGTKAPTFIAKVGNGSTYAESPFLFAKAADVYSWAKKANLALTDIPEITLDSTAAAKIKLAIDANASSIAAEKTRAEGVEAELSGRIDAITGEEGTIAQALAAAKEYADGLNNAMDTRVDALEAAIATKVEQSAYDTKINALETADTNLAEKVTNIENKLKDVTTVMDFVGQRTVTVVDGVITVTALDGEIFSKGDVVVDNAGKEYVYDGTVWAEFGSTTAADAAITQLQADVDALEAKVNTEGTVSAAIEAAVEAEATNRENADTALGNRITAIENLKIADTYATKAEHNTLAGRVTTAEDKISTLEGEMDTAQTDIEAIETDIATNVVKVKTTTDGDSTVNELVVGEDVIIFDCGGAE